jgi:hypothetical protein
VEGLARTWALVAALGAGCASGTLLAPDDRQALERELIAGGHRHLRLSYTVTPFFGDDGKRLLTAAPPDEVRLFEDPSGEPINPGPVEKVLPAGRRARIIKLQFPTPWAIVQGAAFFPRVQPWIFLEVEGEPKGRPLILILDTQVSTRASFLAEVDRYISRTDPAALMEAWGENVRTAVRNKTATLDMPGEALEMAWGYPERKRVIFDAAGNKKEAWIYPGGKRTVQLEDGRISAIEVPDPR